MDNGARFNSDARIGRHVISHGIALVDGSQVHFVLVPHIRDAVHRVRLHNHGTVLVDRTAMFYHEPALARTKLRTKWAPTGLGSFATGESARARGEGGSPLQEAILALLERKIESREMLEFAIVASAAALVEHREDVCAGTRKNEAGILDLSSDRKEYVDRGGIDRRASIKI